MSRLFLVPLAVVMSILAIAQVGAADDKQEAARLRSEESKIKAEIPLLVERIEELSKQLESTQAERSRVEEKAQRSQETPEAAPKLAELRNALESKAKELQHELGKYKSTLQTKSQQLAELGNQVKRTTEKARDEFNRGPGEEVARHIHQLQKQLAEATEAGKKEIADRLKKELRDYAVETASKKLLQARQSGEAAFKQQMEAMEERIRELREQGKPEIAERMATQFKNLIHSHRSRQEAVKQLEDRCRELTRRAIGQPEQADAVARRRQAESVEPQSRIAEQRRTEERRAFAQRADQLEREINRLRESGHHEEAERLQQELRGMTADPRRRALQAQEENRGPHDIGPEERRELERRVHHLRAAAENLAAIGMHDLVERLSREAEDIEKVLHTPPPGAPPHEGIMEAIHHEFQTIHQRLDELTGRLDELARQRRDRDEP